MKALSRTPPFGQLIRDGEKTIEQEFLPYIQLPDGTSIGDVLIPQISVLASGTLALPGGSK